MFEVFEEWFGQGLNSGVLLIDVGLFIIGFYIMRKTNNKIGKRIVLISPLVLLIFAIIGSNFHNWSIIFMSVYLCGCSTMLFLGAIAALAISRFKGFKHIF